LTIKTKVCSKCKEEKPLSDFCKNSSSKDGYRANCKSCSRNQVKLHYNNNKEKYLSRNLKSREIRRLRVDELKKSKYCIICGESRNYCLDFHHIDPKTKESSISEMIRHECSDEKLRAEIAKCVVLCGNCHRAAHFGTEEEKKEIQDAILQEGQGPV
jgi:hypothetical protein